jgi:hypothetical protein
MHIRSCDTLGMRHSRSCAAPFFAAEFAAQFFADRTFGDGIFRYAGARCLRNTSHDTIRDTIRDSNK